MSKELPLLGIGVTKDGELVNMIDPTIASKLTKLELDRLNVLMDLASQVLMMGVRRI